MHEDDENKILENVLDNLSPGAVILLHELPQTINILSELIHGIRAKGYHLRKPHRSLNFESIF